MLSTRDRAEFAERGIVWLPGAFGADEAARMRRRVWARLGRLGAAEDDPVTWASADVTGLSKAVKRDRVFAALGSPAVRGAVDDLLGRDGWDPPRQPYEGHLLGRYLRRDDWFRALSRPGDDDPGRAALFMDRDHDAGGILVRVAELTGQPGDVVLTHPWVLHSWSSNTGSYPRMMLTKNLYRRGLFRPDGGYRRGVGPAGPMRAGRPSSPARSPSRAAPRPEAICRMGRGAQSQEPGRNDLRPRCAMVLA